jgi:rhodanese-related sulfurtransferase
MRKKIIGAVICVMLSFTSLSALGEADIHKDTKILDEDYYKQTIQENITMSIYSNTLFLGMKLDVKNNGAETYNNVEWNFRYKAVIRGSGIFIVGRVQSGVINELNPGETKTFTFSPFDINSKSPIGLGNLYMNATVEINGEVVRTQQRAFLFGIFLIAFKDTYTDLSPKQAYEKYLDNDFDLIIDVVGLDIYNLGHLPGAINYVWADGTLSQKIPTLDKELTYLVYCHTDPPSTDSAQAMVDAGFDNIYRLEGNYAAWRDAGYPTET